MKRAFISGIYPTHRGVRSRQWTIYGSYDQTSRCGELSEREPPWLFYIAWRRSDRLRSVRPFSWQGYLHWLELQESCRGNSQKSYWKPGTIQQVLRHCNWSQNGGTYSNLGWKITLWGWTRDSGWEAGISSQQGRCTLAWLWLSSCKWSLGKGSTVSHQLVTLWKIASWLCTHWPVRKNCRWDSGPKFVADLSKAKWRDRAEFQRAWYDFLSL